MGTVAKVGAARAPTESLVAQAEFSVTDATGRVIVLRRPDVLAEFQIVEVLGDSAQNAAYMGMIMPLLWISSIDGSQVTVPNTKMEVNALIQRLGHDGIGAVFQGVQDQILSKAEAKKKSGE